MQDIPLDTKKCGPSSQVLQEIIRQAPVEYGTVGWLTSHRHSFGIVLLCLGLLATAGRLHPPWAHPRCHGGTLPQLY